MRVCSPRPPRCGLIRLHCVVMWQLLGSQYKDPDDGDLIPSWRLPPINGRFFDLHLHVQTNVLYDDLSTLGTYQDRYLTFNLLPI